MDATSGSTSYSRSNVSALDTTGFDSGQNSSSELESIFNSLMKMSKDDGSAEIGGSAGRSSGGGIVQDLDRVLLSLLNVLEDQQGVASSSAPSVGGGSGSNAPGGADGTGMGAGSAADATGGASGGASDQAAGAPGDTSPGGAADAMGGASSGASGQATGTPGNTSQSSASDTTGSGAASQMASVPGSTDVSPGASGALSSMPTESAQPANPSQVMNSGMSAGKTQVYDALKQQGATPQEIAMVMGSGMVETNDFNADQRDASKDGTSSANYSAFNLNEPELQKLGYTGDPSALNNQNNIGQVADLLLNGIRKDGFNEVAGMTRDSVNFDPNSSDIQQWDAERNADASKLLQLYQQEGTQAFTNNERVASYSQHI